jgi:hypothetical protein
MTVITILQMPAGFLHCDILQFHLSAVACTEPARSPLVRRSQPGKTGPSPSAGLGGRFGEQPDHPQVLDGLIWAFRTFRVFWSGWYSEPVVVVLSGFDGWPVIKGPLYRAGTTPPSIRRSAPVM